MRELDNLNYIVQFYYIYFWEVCNLKNIVMAIFCHNKLGIAGNGAVYKFIIVRVRNNQMEMIIGCNKECMRIIRYHVES